MFGPLADFAQTTSSLDLLKLLPEGTSVIAVIVVVILFLRQQDKQQKQIEQIAITFNNRIKEITDSFQTQIDRLAQEIFQHEQQTRSQMQGLFDGFMKLSRETIGAVVELKGAFESLRQRIDEDRAKK
jgi:hypothetical protein